MDIKDISNKEEKSEAFAELYCDCFFNDPFFNRVLPNPEIRKRRLVEYFRDIAKKFTNSNAILDSRGRSVFGCKCIGSETDPVAILMYFNYGEVLRNDVELFTQIFSGERNGELPHFFEIHEPVRSLDGDTIFILTLAVARKHRRQKVGSSMLSWLMREYPGYNFAVDVSNPDSRSLYLSRGFFSHTLIEAEIGYELFLFNRLRQVEVDICNVQTALSIQRKLFPLTSATVNYYESVNGLSSARYFIVRQGSVDVGITGFYVVNGDERSLWLGWFGVLEEYRRRGYGSQIIGLFEEEARKRNCNCVRLYTDAEGNDAALEFYRRVGFVSEKSYSCGIGSDSHNVMVLSKSLGGDALQKWGGSSLDLSRQFEIQRPCGADSDVIPDVYVMMPVIKKQGFSPSNCSEIPSPSDIGFLLDGLDHYTRSEFCHHAKDERGHSYCNDDELKSVPSDLYERMSRIYLGKVKLGIRASESVNEKCFCGTSIIVDLFLSHDRFSRVGALSFMVLAMPFPLSMFMEKVTQGDLFVVGDEGVSFVDYVRDRFLLEKRGDERIFVEFHCERNLFSDSELASLLAGERIGGIYGNLIDKDILDIVRENSGMGSGQYDRAKVFACKNVILEFNPSRFNDRESLIDEESITVMFLELVLFEIAAVCSANFDIMRLLHMAVSVEDAELFLEENNRADEEYSRSIAFWNVQFKFPTAQKSLDAIRKAFWLDRDVKLLERNREQMQSAFDVKSNIVDRVAARRTNLALAIISLLAVFSALVDSNEFIDRVSVYFGKSVVLHCAAIVLVGVLTFAVLRLFLKIFNARQFFRKERRSKIRR